MTRKGILLHRQVQFLENSNRLFLFRQALSFCSLICVEEFRVLSGNIIFCCLLDYCVNQVKLQSEVTQNLVIRHIGKPTIQEGPQ